MSLTTTSAPFTTSFILEDRLSSGFGAGGKLVLFFLLLPVVLSQLVALTDQRDGLADLPGVRSIQGGLV